MKMKKKKVISNLESKLRTGVRRAYLLFFFIFFRKQTKYFCIGIVDVSITSTVSNVRMEWHCK